MSKLELTWVGKDTPRHIEPRILIHDPSCDYGDAESGNMLIHGDNLLALKALEYDYAGKVKCVYIDPPFNTGARIDADGKEIGYDDGVEHSIWLQDMAERIKSLHTLLREDGALFIHLDDNELDYCKVMVDEIFGRKNFMNRITLKSRSPSAFSVVNPGLFKSSEYILFYAKRRELLVEKSLRMKREPDRAYDKYIENIEEPCEQWRYIPVTEAFARANGAAGTNPLTILNKYNDFVVENAHRIFRFTAISDTKAGAKVVALKKQSLETPGCILRMEREQLDDVYILDGQQLSFYAKNITVIDGKKVASMMLTDIWSDIAWEGIASEGGVRFKKGKKPERLIKRCIELVTEPGDLVLDSFLGSGTTAAVAHKMGRRYIGIEMNKYVYPLCRERLVRVVDGKDPNGITKAVGWKGGGGFRFYTLAPSLICGDCYGNPVISKQYDAEMLAAAVAQHNGFTYMPERDAYWKHGKSQDNSYIYVTTRFVTGRELDLLAGELREHERLLICASAFATDLKGRYENITLRKIAQSVLGKCEYGVENYNMSVEELPDTDEPDEE